MVYLIIASDKRSALLKALESGRLPVMLSDGVPREDKTSIKMPVTTKMVIDESNIAPVTVTTRQYVKAKTTVQMTEIVA